MRIDEFHIGDKVFLRGKGYTITGTTPGRAAYWVLAHEYGGDGFYEELWDLSGPLPRLIKRPWADSE